MNLRRLREHSKGTPCIADGGSPASDGGASDEDD